MIFYGEVYLWGADLLARMPLNGLEASGLNAGWLII